MNIKRMRPLALLVALCTLLLPRPAWASPWSNSRSFASPLFEAQWARTDDARVRGGRSWYWGPSPWFDYYEFSRQSPNGLRLVQYFDKARMEINDPAESRVTNGLLVVELVSGRVRVGSGPGDVYQAAPAAVPVAGDPPEANPDAPTYLSFSGVATLDDPSARRSPERRGQPVDATLGAGGAVGSRPDLAERYAAQTRGAAYAPETGHNIPAVFWGFLNQRGNTLDEGRVRTGPVVDWLQVMGYPISEAYWVRARVGGVERDVLAQLFERRVLTFNPANDAAFQVEMGNVGQHYFRWRYAHLGQPWAAGPPPLPLFYASNRNTPDHWEVFRVSPNGDNATQYLAGSQAESVPYSVLRAYGGYEQVKVLFDSRRGDGAHRQLYAADFNNGLEIARLTYTDGGEPFPASPFPRAATPANDYSPAVSPDGTKIAFVSDRTGQPQLYLMGYIPGAGIGAYGEHAQLTDEGCARESLSWSPDGRALVWAQNCDGDWELVRGELAYTEDTKTFAGRYFANNVRATLVNVTRLTDNEDDDRYPRFSPDGTRIAFSRNQGGGYAIAVRGPAGDVAQLTDGSGGDEAPTWSADGAQLVFGSARSGAWQLYRINLDGGDLRQLTGAPGEGRWPVWAQ
jgi:hypothetical protein